jgi:hypothetical protein
MFCPDVSSRLSTGMGLQCVPIHPPLGLPRVYEAGLICCCAMVIPWGIGLSKEGKHSVTRESDLGKPLSREKTGMIEHCALVVHFGSNCTGAALWKQVPDAPQMKAQRRAIPSVWDQPR